MQIVYNLPPFLKHPFNFIKSCFSKKIQDRFVFIDDSKEFPGIQKNNLPKEYGGTTLTINDMVDMWKSELYSAESKRIFDLNSKNEANMKLMAKNKEFNGKADMSEEVYGSFRNLEVD